MLLICNASSHQFCLSLISTKFVTKYHYLTFKKHHQCQFHNNLKNILNTCSCKLTARIRTRWDFFSVRWDRIRFYFHEMKQNQILFSWNETKSEIFLWDEMRQKTETVLMRQNQVFIKQNISFWFFSQSMLIFFF